MGIGAYPGYKTLTLLDACRLAAEEYEQYLNAALNTDYRGKSYPWTTRSSLLRHTPDVILIRGGAGLLVTWSTSGRFDLIRWNPLSIPTAFAHDDFWLAATSSLHSWIKRQFQQIGRSLPEESALPFPRDHAALEAESSQIEYQRRAISPLPSSQEATLILQAALVFLLKKCTALLKRFVIAQRRLQYMAAQIRDRVSRSPSPFKLEPPVGGTKIGGELPPSSCVETDDVSVAL